MAELLDRITTDPHILGGKPIIRGMRVSVEQIVKALAGGVPAEDLLADIPVLEPDDIRACLAYAARVVEEQSHFVMASQARRHLAHRGVVILRMEDALGAEKAKALDWIVATAGSRLYRHLAVFHAGRLRVGHRWDGP